MKYKNILKGLIALSLIAGTFIATVAAAQYVAYMSGLKAGKNLTLTIDTSTASTADGSSTITNFGLSVDITTIVITAYDNKGIPTTFEPDWTRIAVNPDGTSIVIQLAKQDGLPSQCPTINAQGELTGDYAGNSFKATGPGWGWANIHK